MVTIKQYKKKQEEMKAKAEAEKKAAPAPVVNTPTQTETTKVKTTAPQVIRDEETGEISGFQLPSGKSSIGSSPKTNREMLELYAKKFAAPAGTIEASEVTSQQQKLEMAEQLRQEQIANIPQMQDVLVGEPDLNKQINPLDLATGAGAGIATGLGAGFAASATAAKIGAAAGTAIAPGVGTAIGAGVGFLAGAATFLTKISLDEKQNIKELKGAYSAAIQNLASIKAMVKANPAYRDQALIDWEREKGYVYRIEQILKEKTDSNLLEFLGDGGEELADVQGYLRILPQLEAEFLNDRALSGLTT